MNLMLTYSRRCDVEKEDAIVVRVFGDAAGLSNRDMEVAAMQVNLMGRGLLYCVQTSIKSAFSHSNARCNTIRQASLVSSYLHTPCIICFYCNSEVLLFHHTMNTYGKMLASHGSIMLLKPEGC